MAISMATAIARLKRLREGLDKPALDRFMRARSEQYRSLAREVTLDVMPSLRPPEVAPADWRTTTQRYAHGIRVVHSARSGGFELVLVGSVRSDPDLSPVADQLGGKSGLSLGEVIEWVEAGVKFGHPLGKQQDARDYRPGGGSDPRDAETIARTYLFSPGTTGTSVLNYLAAREISPGQKLLAGLLAAWAPPVKQLAVEHVRDFIREVWKV